MPNDGRFSDERSGAAAPPSRLRRDGKSADTQRLTELRRRQVIDAAIRVVSARGAAATRLMDVADEASVSIGLVQHYFRSRETLLRETILTATQDSVRELEELERTEENPARRLMAALRYCVMRGRWGLWTEVWSTSARDPDLKRYNAEIEKAWTAPFIKMIEDGVQQGLFRIPGQSEETALRLVSLVDGLSVRGVLLEHPGLGRERILALLMQQLWLETRAEEFRDVGFAKSD